MSASGGGVLTCWVIGHTPRDETVSVKLGSAFDVVGERRVDVLWTVKVLAKQFAGFASGVLSGVQIMLHRRI